MDDTFQLAIMILTFLGLTAPLYYRVGKLEVKINQLCKMIKIKARWKK